MHGTEYKPYLFAGLAMGNLDDDVAREIVTIVRADSRWTCFPAVYEVNGASIDLVEVSATSLDCEAHAPALADLDGDGTPEIVFGDRVFDADSLTEIWRGSDFGGEGSGVVQLRRVRDVDRQTRLLELRLSQLCLRPRR